MRTPTATAPEPTTEAEIAGAPVSGATPEPGVTSDGTVTPTPAPTATPIPASVFEFVDQELASIQQIIPALAVGDLTVVCTELNQMIEAINVPGVARALDESINDMAADYWIEGEQRYSVRPFQGLPPPGQIVGAALTPPCLSSAPAPTGIIESLEAQIVGLQVFEAPAPPVPVTSPPDEFSVNFSRSVARYIYWVLDLTHPRPNETIAFAIEAVYYRSAGGVFSQKTVSFQLLQGSSNSQWINGTGFSDSGQWPVDTYRVDLSVDGVLVASETFQVTG